MNEIVNETVVLNSFVAGSPLLETIKEQPPKPMVICGWCGAVEHYISNDRTECPNCDDYLH